MSNKPNLNCALCTELIPQMYLLSKSWLDTWIDATHIARIVIALLTVIANFECIFLQKIVYSLKKVISIMIFNGNKSQKSFNNTTIR